jgi:hypothetical protein
MKVGEINMNLQENISRIKQMMGVIKESRPAKETLDEFVDGKILYNMLTDIHDMVKELARPIYGERQQKANVETFSKFGVKNHNYFVRLAKKYNKIRETERKKPFDIDDIVRLMKDYCGYIIRTSNNPNNQLDGAENFLKHFPDEVKVFDSSKKQEIEEYAKTTGRNSSNFFKGLMFEKDLNLIDIMSNIDYIMMLKDKYNLRLFNLPMGW